MIWHRRCRVRAPTIAVDAGDRGPAADRQLEKTERRLLSTARERPPHCGNCIRRAKIESSPVDRRRHGVLRSDGRPPLRGQREDRKSLGIPDGRANQREPFGSRHTSLHRPRTQDPSSVSTASRRAQALAHVRDATHSATTASTRHRRPTARGCTPLSRAGKVIALSARSGRVPLDADRRNSWGYSTPAIVLRKVSTWVASTARCTRTVP